MFLSIFSINWNKINYVTGFLYIFLQTLCTFFASESLLKAILILLPQKSINKYQNASASVVINYNLKAHNKGNIIECFENMYNAYINNMSLNNTAIIVSVTEDNELVLYENEILIYYREKLLNHLLTSGEEYLQSHFNYNSWWNKTHVSKNCLRSICIDRCSHFMLIHRKSNVLKKCGQYQDLISFIMGNSIAYTYTDKNIYGTDSRTAIPLFSATDNNNLKNIFNVKYEYTLVLDSDTLVPENTINNLINIAKANPTYVIFQPQIELYNINNSEN